MRKRGCRAPASVIHDMPELPEVETIARTLRPQVVGRTIKAVHVILPKTLAAGRELLADLIPGVRIDGVRRRGKLLLLDIASSGASASTHVMAFHLKMTGSLFVHDLGTELHPHTRMVFEFAPNVDGLGTRLFFDDVRTFGYCRVMRLEDLPAWPFWAKLGPEPLAIKASEFSKALGRRRGSIKSLLLNQTVIAGIGNIYADEACFRSGIHPAASGSRLSEKQRGMLLENVQEVLLESIEECGSSIRNYRDANGDAGAFQNLFRVYGRAGLSCMECDGRLEKIVIVGRTTVFCPRCQKMP